jgi:hypothetical protein
VIGIATDFTASTCMPVLADGTPLCQLPGLAGGGKNAVQRTYDKADRWMLALTRAWAMMPT